ncbi:MAG TPA: tRNA (adenosine(37)-N6)-dimethylallyltransferase MiaA [Candidatus Omnitrophica bacterium]|nr:tRNA (adenosine(37)-N6)-dimethylallyltransferase MiaA [Candidatus Omnitrophota bacterium]
MPKVIFIVGPTATGKTETSFLLAEDLKAEIISSDSMLIYKEPQIITSKPPSYMLKKIPHHFVGIISVKDTYNVFDYYLKAIKKIKDLFNQGKNIIVCGGSGLYIKVILDGIFEGPAKDENLRRELQERLKNYGRDYLFEELKRIDPQTAKKISVSDHKRIIRALEVYYLSGIPISEKKRQANGLWRRLPIKIFGLRLKRKELYERINRRVEEMFEKGAVEEVCRLLKMDLSITAEKIIGIKEIKDYLEGNIDFEKAKEEMKKNTRHFAKRQITWFKKDKRIEWIDIDGLTSCEIKEEIKKRL